MASTTTSVEGRSLGFSEASARCWSRCSYHLCLPRLTVRRSVISSWKKNIRFLRCSFWLLINVLWFLHFGLRHSFRLGTVHDSTSAILACAKIILIPVISASCLAMIFPFSQTVFVRCTLRHCGTWACRHAIFNPLGLFDDCMKIM